LRIEWLGDEIEAICTWILARQKDRDLDKIAIYPSTHYVVTPIAPQVL